MEEKTVRMKRLYEGRIVSLELHDVVLEDGREAVREVVRHDPAVGVIAEMHDGRFALVRQYRKPVDCEMLEIVAGGCNAGEDPETSARRELQEETGYAAGTLERLGAIYPSPGYVDERIEIFYARLEERPSAKDFDEDEHVELVVLGRDDVLARIRSGDITDAKTLAGWLLYEQWRAAQ